MSSTPPTGTVTFLFTDVEGSTALWENHPTRMPRVIERHDRILREAVEAHDGYVFKTVGDACHSVFDRPREALRAALSAQRALFTENWGGAIGSLRVRMALHTGSAEQEREGDYFGPAVNRVARLLGPAHGGQVLLSSATYGQVYDHPELVDEEARFVSLGEHRLKDLTHPELVYQLTVPDLPEKFPPLRTQENPEEGDRYRIKDFLGSGGMAKVYMAHDEKLDRDVAMKVLQPRYGEDEELVKRFEREARSTARLSHPNIVPAYDRGQKEDGSYYIVMEYLPRGTLKDLVVREGPLPPRTAVELALQIARALEAAHQEGIVHRDIKPQNVLLSRRGEAKVTDFGICRAVSESTLTRVGSMVGTPHYMSPELAEGQRADFRSDLYSLGVILYEMLTGELPFNAETPAAIISQQLRGQVSPPREINPEVPERVEAVVMRLLARDPEDRYPDATALIDDLRQVSRSLEEQGEDNGGLVRPPSRAATTQKKEVFAGTVVGDAKAPSLVEVPDVAGKDVFMANGVFGQRGPNVGRPKRSS